MLETTSPLKNTLLHSPLGQQSTLRPKHGRGRRTMFASLMLTSLVDAFSILVIFLIMNTSANQESLDVDMQKLALPKATDSQLIMEGITVRVDGNSYLVEKQPIPKSQLVAHLKQLFQSSTQAKKEGIIIVADKNMDYDDLNPVILAGSQAGFSKFKFAVISSDKK